MANNQVTIDEEFRMFHFNLGLAISLWVQVEMALCNCILTGFKKEEHDALSVGFLSIENFRSKLEYADKVIFSKHARNPEGYYWLVLLDRLQRASKLRNLLAHRAVAVYPHCKPGRRMILVPLLYEEPKKKSSRPMPPPGSFGVLDIVKHAGEFLSLRLALENYAARLLGQKEPHPKSDEQPGNPPTIQTLARQIGGEPPYQP